MGVVTAYPAATQRPCSNHSGPMTAHLGLVLHVQEGTNDLGAEFNDPNSDASYHWVVSTAGGVDQFVDADLEAWAQVDGNGDYNSVGTQGFSTEALTEEACQTIAQLYAWGHAQYGWPYVLAEKPGDPGFGWHGMGGADWGNHPDCPGALRRGQRQHILDLAQGADDDMTPEQSSKLDALYEDTFATDTPAQDSNGTKLNNHWAIGYMKAEVDAIKTDVEAIKTSLGALVERLAPPA